MSYEMKMDAEMVRRHEQSKGNNHNIYLSASDSKETLIAERNKPYYESTNEFQKYLNMILAQSSKDAADVDWNLLAHYSECMLTFAVKNAEISKQIGAINSSEQRKF